MSHPILKATHELGQSLWLDFISRELLDSGGLERHVAEGVRGVTSNPTIFQKAISSGSDYDKDIRAGIAEMLTTQQIFERLAVSDVARAADVLSGVYASSEGTDGFVSLEVSPTLAHDTQGTVQEAISLWERVNRPNLMIKVPGTAEGLPAVEILLRRGINVNITLLFSIEQYKQVLETYLSALEHRLEDGHSISDLASVASFFVSRVDTQADKELRAAGYEKLAGKSAIANACLAYRHFLEVLKSERWQRLLNAGAQAQRPLWASTSTKDPTLSDTLYLDELIAAQTVNTVPPHTLDAFKDHGRPAARLLDNMKRADDVLDHVAAAGVKLEQITNDLIEDGVKKFADSFAELLDAIERKREQIQQQSA